MDVSVGRLIASDPVVVFPETEIAEAARLMRDREVGALAVCNGERVVGTVTARDIVIRQVAEGCEFRLVGSVMTPDPQVIESDEPIDRALALMAEHRVDHLLVCQRGKLVGTVSLSDLATCSIGGQATAFGRLNLLLRALEDVEQSLAYVHPAREALQKLEWRLSVGCHHLLQELRAAERDPRDAEGPVAGSSARCALPTGADNASGQTAKELLAHRSSARRHLRAVSDENPPSIA